MFKDLTYNELMKRASLFFALLISFWIPQYKFVLSLFIAFWFLFNLFEGKFLFRLKGNYSKSKLFFFLLQISFFLVIVLGYFISNDKEYASDLIIKKLSFFIFPILFLLSNKYFKENKYLFLKLFVFSNFVASVISFGFALYYSVNIIDGNLIFNAFDEVGYSFFTYSNFSAFHHPAYFSIYLVFSITIIFYLKKQARLFKFSKYKILFYVLVIYFSFIVFLLSSRAGIITLLMFFLWKTISYIKSKSGLIKLFALFTIVFIIIILSFNTRVQGTFITLKAIVEKGKSYDFYPARLILWEAATEVVEENIWLGTGTGDAISELNKKTKSYNMRLEKVKNLNAHNQFLDTFLSSGLLGFFILMSIIVYGFIFSRRYKNELFAVFLSLIVFNFLFESMLNTIAGIVFFAYFLNYFVFIFEKNDKYSIKEKGQITIK